MGSVADAYDNSMAESFVSTLETRTGPPSFMAEPPDSKNGFSAEYIEGFYNTRRRHSARGHLSPSEYEEVRLKGDAVA